MLDIQHHETGLDHGEGASPGLYRQTLIVNWDHEGQSYLFALDKQTGDKPFFLYLSHYAVHTPIQAKQQLIAKYRDKSGSNGQTSENKADFDWFEYSSQE